MRFNKKALSQAHAALAKNNLYDLTVALTDAWRKTAVLEKKNEIEELLDFIAKNQENIIDYRQQLKAAGFEVDDTWRSMGAAESNVDKFKHRICKCSQSWSEKGLNGMLTCLTKHFEYILPEYIFRTPKELKKWDYIDLKTGAGHLTKKALKTVKAHSQL